MSRAELFVFDPDYRRNGKFYTVHMEESAMAGSSVPDNKNFPGLNATGYTPTPAVGSPGPAIIEGVIVEWTDTDISNSTFEGRAREILRVQLTGKAHPMGEIIFNPTAKPGDPDWRVMYVGQGDSASGESNTPFRSNPQRLDTLLGKVLRIIPDLNEHTSTSTVSDNGRYRIPNDNPFVSKPGARKEIWAYGFRNPHRLSWAIDPANPGNNRLIVNSIGLTRETINTFIRAPTTDIRSARGTRSSRTTTRPGRCPRSIRSSFTFTTLQPRNWSSRSIRLRSTDTTPAVVMPSEPATSIKGKRFQHSRASTCSPTSRPATFSTPITKRCLRPTMASRARWRRFIS